MRIQTAYFILWAIVLFMVAGGASTQPHLQRVTPASIDCTNTVNAQVTKWKRAFRVDDWGITAVCGIPLPYGGNDGKRIGMTLLELDSRTAQIYISPKAETIGFDRVCFHEVLHILLYQTVKADSDQVTEQTIRTLTDLYFKGERKTRR